MSKPLHVQVAEALGEEPLEHAGGFGWTAPRYDTDWSATGPLIEKYRVRLLPPACCIDCDDHATDSGANNWTAEDEAGVIEGYGKTPLVAICNFIIESAKVGRL